MQTIFVVQNDHFFAKELKDKLERNGYAVSVFEDGFVTYQAILEQKPGAVIFDFDLPGMDGMTLLRKKDENPEIQNIPFIAVTKDTNESKRLQARYYGVHDYILKTDAAMQQILDQIQMISYRWRQMI